MYGYMQAVTSMPSARAWFRVSSVWGMVWVPPVDVMWSTCTEAPVVRATSSTSAMAVALSLPGSSGEEYRTWKNTGMSWALAAVATASISAEVTHGVYSGSNSTPIQPAAKPSSTRCASSAIWLGVAERVLMPSWVRIHGSSKAPP